MTAAQAATAAETSAGPLDFLRRTQTASRAEPARLAKLPEPDAEVQCSRRLTIVA
jgi:hypothetical protein